MSAVEAGRSESRFWASMAGEWTADRHPALWDDVAPSEAAVVLGYDPAEDLDRRGQTWGYGFTGHDLADLARFAAALSATEAEAWRDGTGDVATRAYEDRRFLIGDRILHWAVPWLDTVGRCYSDLRSLAHDHRDRLLLLADEQRPAASLTGTEGIVPPGYDSFGPLEPAPPVLSLWSGALLLRATIRSLLGEADAARTKANVADSRIARDLSALYDVNAMRWRRMAREHPGSSRLWDDLAARASRTAATG